LVSDIAGLAMYVAEYVQRFAIRVTGPFSICLRIIPQ
jgi:hypothetical protein